MEARSRVGLVVTVGLGAAAGPLDSAVNVAFPAIIAAFGQDVAAIQWVIICYVLTYSSLLLGFGRLADMFGHRRVFVTGTVWSIAALLACTLATQFDWFLLARVAQGIGTAMLLSTGPALLTLSFPASERTRALALYAMAIAIATACGPLAAAMLVNEFGWQAVYWFRIPILLLSALGVWWFVKPTPVAPAAGSFDALGVLFMVVAVVGAMFSINQATGSSLASHWIGLSVLVAVTASALFVFRTLRVKHPIIDLRLFRYPLFAVANLSHILANAASFTIMLLVPFYLSRILDNNATAIGWYLAIYPLGAVAASLVARRAIGKLGARRVGIGALVLSTFGLWLVTNWSIPFSPVLIAVALAVHGYGVGLFQVAAVDVVMATVPRTQQGVGGSLNMLTRTLGVVMGASVGSILFASFGGQVVAADNVFIDAFTSVFDVAVWVSVAALVVLATIGHRDHPASPRTQ
jgi:EmrB/QacA subfamily drug resistance transporter